MKIKRKAYLVGHMEFDKETKTFDVTNFGIYGAPSGGLTQRFDEIIFDILESGDHDEYGDAVDWIKTYVKQMIQCSPGWAFIHKEITKYDDKEVSKEPLVAMEVK
jgi:hypothetical protein